MGTLCSSFLFRLLSPYKGELGFERQTFRATEGIKMERTPLCFSSVVDGVDHCFLEMPVSVRYQCCFNIDLFVCQIIDPPPLLSPLSIELI